MVETLEAAEDNPKPNSKFSIWGHTATTGKKSESIMLRLPRPLEQITTEEAVRTGLIHENEVTIIENYDSAKNYIEIPEKVVPIDATAYTPGNITLREESSSYSIKIQFHKKSRFSISKANAAHKAKRI